MRYGMIVGFYVLSTQEAEASPSEASLGLYTKQNTHENHH